MKIEKLSKSTIKIQLNNKELESCGVSISDIRNSNDVSKCLLNEIIALAMVKVDYSPESDNFIIEVFSLGQECIIYISCSDSQKYKKAQTYVLICEIQNSTDIFSLCELLASKSNYIKSSSLFSDRKGKIYIVIKTQLNFKKQLKHILCEFGMTSEENECMLNAFFERYKIIFENDAVDNINKMIKT